MNHTTSNGILICLIIIFLIGLSYGNYVILKKDKLNLYFVVLIDALLLGCLAFLGVNNWKSNSN